MKGGCHCKALRFKTSETPYWVGACYCIDCRNISGAPYVVWAGFKPGQVELVSGSLRIYTSSEKVRRTFCSTCNAPFSFTYTEHPNEYFIPVGIFDDPSTLHPLTHIFVSQKLPWVTINDTYPQDSLDQAAHSQES